MRTKADITHNMYIGRYWQIGEEYNAKPLCVRTICRDDADSISTLLSLEPGPSTLRSGGFTITIRFSDATTAPSGRGGASGLIGDAGTSSDSEK